MDSGLDSLLIVLRRHYGAVGISTASRLNSTTAFYGCLFWVSWVDSLLFCRRKSKLAFLANGVVAKVLAAPKHDSHAFCGSDSTRFPHLVSDQLLPDGLQRTAPCQHFRRPQGSSLDDQLNGHVVLVTAAVFLCRDCTVHDVNVYVSSTQILVCASSAMEAAC